MFRIMEGGENRGGIGSVKKNQIESVEYIHPSLHSIDSNQITMDKCNVLVLPPRCSSTKYFFFSRAWPFIGMHETKQMDVLEGIFRLVSAGKVALPKCVGDATR